jgi:hypothetical protein
MKYLNEETQFTRVSEEHARGLMESLGYTVPIQSAIISDVYLNEGRRFSLEEEVVEADDNNLYVRLMELSDGSITHVDESGRDFILESVTFEETEYVLEGLYDDGEGGLFARLVDESVKEVPAKDEDEEDEDEDDYDNGDPKAFGGKKGDKSKTHGGKDFEKGDPKAFGGKKGDKSKTHAGKDFEKKKDEA